MIVSLYLVLVVVIFANVYILLSLVSSCVKLFDVSIVVVGGQRDGALFLCFVLFCVGFEKALKSLEKCIFINLNLFCHYQYVS
jgi:hypothetical protein